MSYGEPNRFGEMSVFVRVVEQGGFSAAARLCRMTPSAVSKLVTRLEQRLGARLFNRSTRKLQLTPEGLAFYERSLRLLAELEEAERAVSSGEHPTGRVRINTNASFANHVLSPLVPQFIARHPAVTLDIVLTDAVIDLLDERVDVAVRAGPLKNSSLRARKLGATPMIIVAAPAYLERSGTPQRPEDLETHNRLGFCYGRSVEGWPLLSESTGSVTTLPTVGRIQTSDGEALRYLALGGAGVARLAAFTVREDIAAGRLIPLLEAYNPGDREEFHAVFPEHGGQLPARVRAFLDFLVENVRLG